MRLWTLHPSLLDAKGLVAGWREALLALHVLDGRTVGYRNHPQLDRFKGAPDPLAAIRFFLSGLFEEAQRRDYRFDGSKIGPFAETAKIPVTSGQVDYEYQFLIAKLRVRDPARAEAVAAAPPRCHALFTIVPGEVEPWERVTPTRS